MLRRISALLAAGAAYAVSTGPAAADPISIGSFIISAFLTSGLGALLPTVSAALIGNVVLGAAVVGSMLVQSALMKVPSIQPEKFKSVFRGDNDTSEIRAIGRVRIGGLVAFGNTKGKNRYRLICHTRGPWMGTEEHYLGGREVVVDDDGSVSSPPWATIGGTNVTIKSKPGVGVDTAWPELVSEFLELWSEDHTLSGIHQSLVKYVSPGMDTPEASERHIKLFQGGEPPYEKVGRAEPVYDPRDGAQSPTDEATWEWRDNAITGAAHILRSFPSISASDLDYTSIAPEADKADVMVETLTGTAPRARAWGFWTSESARGEIMEQVLSSIGAEIVPTDDNRYTIRLVDDDPPAEITFYRQHLVEGDYASGPESVQRPNICRIKYYCPERNFDFADIDLTAAPWARVQDEIDRVGEQIETIELPFCPDASQAQRIGRRLFALRRADAGIMRLNYAGVAAWGLTVANLPFPDIGEDGATVWKKCAIGSPRINDEEGLVDLPFVVWPDLPPWDPETMEAPAPEEIPDLQYPSDLDTPDEPAEYAQVEYPDTTREIRIRFTGVEGGTIAEATRRNYTGGVPETWASMTEYRPSPIENGWYAYAEADYDGDAADFRVRFFNDDGDASYWSDTLEVRPVAIDNTAPDAPTLEQDNDMGTPINAFRGISGAINVARIRLQYNDGGGWTNWTTFNARPQQATPWGTVPPPGTGEAVSVRCVALTSDGTPSAPSNILVISGPPGGG